MIAVIADDLTGAAELGGIGLRHNLKVEVATEVDVNTDAELLIIPADTRSIGEEEAIGKIKQISKELIALKPQLVYKKIDSVLRGHVIAEAKAQMEVMQLNRALVVAANPYLGRTIKNGQYYFKGEPIHLSSFSNDPEFPVKSSLITDMLRYIDVVVLMQDQPLPMTGIAVGEVETDEDLKTWAGKVDKTTMLVGAAGFFTALLEKMNLKRKEMHVELDALQDPMLYVIGTTFNKSRVAVKGVKEIGGPVAYMPKEIITGASDKYEDWRDEIVECLVATGKAIIAIEETSTGDQASANTLREKTAAVVEQILLKTKVKELIVEGGSTAASIIRQQNFTRLIPVQELSAGVIRMKVEGKENLYMTIKPGSYDWSPNLWKF